jgi:hypothetical protein
LANKHANEKSSTTKGRLNVPHEDTDMSAGNSGVLVPATANHETDTTWNVNAEAFVPGKSLKNSVSIDD